MKWIDNMLDKIAQWLLSVIPDYSDQLSRIEQCFNQIDNHISELEQQIDKLENRFGTIDLVLDEMLKEPQSSTPTYTSNSTLSKKYFDRKFSDLADDIKRVPTHSVIKEVFQI